MVKARAADSFMDMSIRSYGDRKLDFLNRYNYLRGGKIAWKQEVTETDPLKIFFLEKEGNKTFNKNLLSDREVLEHLKKKWPNLIPTGKSGIPFLYGKTPVINNVKIAEGLIEKGHDQEVGMIVVFESSNIRKGFSKKTGKPYQMLNIRLSDGYTTIEAVDWNRTKPLRYPPNSIIYVKGTLREGYKESVSINIKEIELIG